MTTRHTRPRTIAAPPALAAACVVLALAARMPGIGWGLPHVYEEAQPLKHAWAMWGWGDRPFDPNPHFFHYPSLVFYTQLAGQAALYSGMKTAQRIDTTAEFRVRYHTDPTPFYLLGRFITTLFALAAVALTWRLGRRAGGVAAGAAAAFLLAVNVLHVSRSQMVDVDVPLVAFVVWALVAATALATSPSPRRYLVLGAAIGLATSTKYTGAMLLFPLVAAHAIALRSDSPGIARPRACLWLAAAVGAATTTFAVTSPYAVLDFPAFRADLALEREHMRLGHFGQGGAAWRFYLAGLARSWAGVPALAFAAFGVVASLRRRAPWAIVAAAFVVPYAAAISSWEMMADRYALPIVPVVLVFGAFGARSLAERFAATPARRAAATAAAALVMAVPVAWAFPAHVAERTHADSRTECRAWIEQNLPPGSLVVTEAYGPPLFGPLDFWEVEGDVRASVYGALAHRGFYGVLPIPLFQSAPEQTEAYYDVDLYAMADVVITTGAVRGRYAQDPARFPQHAAFYDSLGARYRVAAAFDARGEGPSITVHALRPHEPPFATRAVDAPRALRAVRPERALPARWRSVFYYRVGLNYEAFGHLDGAMAAYEMALPGVAGDSEVFKQVAFGVVRTLSMQERWDAAETFIEEMKKRAPTAGDRAFVQTLARSLRGVDQRR